MLSVIVPIYNVELYLQRALDSLIAQDLKNVEFLLICDGVADNSPDIAKEYAKQDSRFRVIVKDNEGYGSTCNLGMKEAKGDYIAIFEPDDHVSHQMYSTLYSLAKEHKVDIVCCNFTRIRRGRSNINPEFLSYISDSNDGELLPNIKPLSDDVFYGRSSDTQFCFDTFGAFSRHPSIWTKLYRKQFLIDQKIQFRPTPGASFQDHPFHIETFVKARSFLFVNKAFYYYYIHKNNSTATMFRAVYRYPLLDHLNYLVDTKIEDFIPKYALPGYYRAFLHHYIWGLKASHKMKLIWNYCSKISTWLSSHPWPVDSSYTKEELQLLSAYKTGHHLSQFFYSIQAVIFQFRPHSYLAKLCVITRKILTALRIIGVHSPTHENE